MTDKKRKIQVSQYEGTLMKVQNDIINLSKQDTTPRFKRHYQITISVEKYYIGVYDNVLAIVSGLDALGIDDHPLIDYVTGEANRIGPFSSTFNVYLDSLELFTVRKKYYNLIESIQPIPDFDDNPNFFTKRKYNKNAW